MLELYDVHGGKRRAEELHFRGLPKVKVMIHEYEPGNPFRSDAYPEPKFDDLSRVRVLHVFRDRGGHEGWSSRRSTSPGSRRRCWGPVNARSHFWGCVSSGAV